MNEPKPKWTPGMWMVAGPDLPRCVVATDDPSVNLLDWNETEGLAMFPSAGAAALCAAAPDLYAALLDLDALYTKAWDLVEPSGAVMFSPETVATFEKLHEAASIALAKARGDQP